MGIFTKVTNWLYGTTPSAPKVAPTLLAAGSAKPAKKSAAKKTTKKSTGKKTKK